MPGYGVFEGNRYESPVTKRPAADYENVADDRRSAPDPLSQQRRWKGSLRRGATVLAAYLADVCLVQVPSAEMVRSAPGRPRRVVDSLLKAACLGYLLTLSLLLLCEDPLRSSHLRTNLLAWLRSLAPVAHLLGFLALTVLVMAARWSVSRWLPVVFLLAYACGTELLQGCVPGRSPERVDLVQNSAGIAVGLAIWWLVTNLATRLTVKRGTTIPNLPP